MKKLLAIALCLLLLAGCAETYDGPTELKSVLGSQEESYLDAEGNVYETLRTEYSYDIYGNPARILESRDGEPSLRTDQRFYEDGSLKSFTQYDLSGWFPRLTLHAEYTYDDQGRPTRIVQWYGLDKKEQVTTYDDENHIVTIDFNGTKTIQYLNEEGQPLRSETEFGDGSTSVMEYEYGERTRTVREFINGEPGTVWEYTYDDQGRELEWYETKDGKRELVWRYEYGEGYVTCHYGLGFSITTGYNEDGTVKASYETGEDGLIRRHTICRYTEIRVPAEEGATP